MNWDRMRQSPRRSGVTTSWLVLFLLCELVFGPIPSHGAEDNSSRTRLVVVLYPQNSDGSPGYFEVDQTLRKIFAAESKHPIKIYNEYLDISKPNSETALKLQINYLKQKYAGRRVDLVIAGLSTALDFALGHRDVFSNAPVVFCAVESREIQSLDLPPDVIGSPCQFDLEGTLELALGLHPNLKHVAVVAGNAPMDLRWEEEARRIFYPYRDRLDFTYLTGLTMEDLENKVAALPPKSMIYYLHVFQDGAGTILIPANVVERLSKHANAPIYSHVNTYVGRGIVGGRVFQFSTEGENAARLGLRILDGEKPEDLGIQKPSETAAMFDDRQLQRFEIDPALLPPGSIVQFQDLSFWERFRWRILGISMFMILQAILIFGLLFQRVKWRRVENRFRQAIEDLKTSQHQLRQLSVRLIEVQEQERRRIARELHDDFNQTLALLAVKLDMLRQKPPRSQGELEIKLNELSSQVRDLSSALHELSHELHPLKLEQLGLVTSIQSLCKEVFQNHSLKIEFHAEQTSISVPPEIALCLYRIVQESLRNIIKHSGAKEAKIRMTADKNEFRLEIADRGNGFDTARLGKQGGLGFISMQERLRLVGGVMFINSQPFQGTTIQIRVPLLSSESRQKPTPQSGKI